MDRELTTDEVLQRSIPWETYLTARLISDRDLQLIRRFDKSTETKQSSLVEEVRAPGWAAWRGHIMRKGGYSMALMRS